MSVEPTTPAWVSKVEVLRADAGAAAIKSLGPLRFGPDTPPLSEHPSIFLRDSMIYRAESVGFHVDLLKSHFAEFERRANTVVITSQRDPMFLRNCLRVLTFLTDDVLFNAISMLDYAGNLVSCTLVGPNEQSRKWNNTVKAARDVSSRTGQSAAGRTMVTLHAEWVDKLHGVRSKIIHERMALGDGSQTITFSSDSFNAALSFQLPVTIVRRLPFLLPLANDGAVDLVRGTEQIALHAIDATSVVVKALLADLGGPPTTSQ